MRSLTAAVPQVKGPQNGTSQNGPIATQRNEIEAGAAAHLAEIEAEIAPILNDPEHAERAKQAISYERKTTKAQVRRALALIDEINEKQASEPKTASPYKFHTLQQMAEMPRYEWLVRGLLIEKTTSIISADSGAFKSFILLDMAICIALGRPYLGRETKQGNVVYVAAEGFYTIYERALAWSIHHDCELPENLHILDIPVNLADEDTLALFAQALRDIEPVFIVLDTLSQNASGMNENDNAAMADFIRGMMLLGKHIGAHVTVLHHNAKSTGAFRGAGSIKANADAHITLDKPDNAPDDDYTVFMRCEKQRGKPFAPFTLRGIKVDLPFCDEYGEQVDSLVFEPCGDAVSPKADRHPSTQKAEKTRAALMEVFDRLAAKGDGVKIGTWKGEVEEANPPICSNATFWTYRKKIEDEGIIRPCGAHNGSGLYERTASTPSTPSTPSYSSWSDQTNNEAQYSKYSNNPLGVGVLGVRAEVTDAGAVVLPNMPPTKTGAAKCNGMADSEAYLAPEADDRAIFGEED